jgi:hypothetical protein
LRSTPYHPGDGSDGASFIIGKTSKPNTQCATHDRSDLISTTIQPGLEDAHEALSEVFEEMNGQLDKEIERIRELMRLRRDDPGEKSAALHACRTRPTAIEYS